MFTIIGNAIICIFWGLLIASILTFILYFMLKALYGNFRMSITGMAMCFILFILLFVQGTLMAGAFHAKGYVDDMGTFVLEMIRNNQGNMGELTSSGEAEKAKRQISEAFPMLSSYISYLNAEELGSRSTSAAIAVTRGIKSLINWYILRRVLWMAGMMITGGVLTGWTGRRGETAYKQPPRYSTSGKHAGTYPGWNRPGRSNGF